MIGDQMAPNWAVIGLIGLMLLIFGIAYNYLMDKLGDRKQPYTAIYVAGGVLVTLVGVALIDWHAAVITLGAFVASGLPMIIGDMRRNMERQAKAEAEAKQQLEERTG